MTNLLLSCPDKSSSGIYSSGISSYAFFRSQIFVSACLRLRKSSYHIYSISQKFVYAFLRIANLRLFHANRCRSLRPSLPSRLVLSVQSFPSRLVLSHQSRLVPSRRPRTASSVYSRPTASSCRSRPVPSCLVLSVPSRPVLLVPSRPVSSCPFCWSCPKYNRALTDPASA